MSYAEMATGCLFLEAIVQWRQLCDLLDITCLTFGSAILLVALLLL